MKRLQILFLSLFLSGVGYSQNLPDPEVFTKIFFAQDKLLHLGAGYAIGATTTAIADRFGAKKPELWGIGFTVLAAAGKELYDYKTGGTPELLDGIMAFNGGFLGTVTVMIPINKRAKKDYSAERRRKENFIDNDPFY